MASTEAVQVQIAIPKFKDIFSKNISCIKYPIVPLKIWLKYTIQMSLLSFELHKHCSNTEIKNDLLVSYNTIQRIKRSFRSSKNMSQLFIPCKIDQFPSGN